MSQIKVTPEGFEISHHDLTVSYDKEGDYVVFQDGLILGVKYDSLINLRMLLLELIDRIDAERGLDAKLREMRTNDGTE